MKLFVHIIFLVLLWNCKESNSTKKEQLPVKKETLTIYTKPSTLKNKNKGFNSPKAINKIAAIENEYFNERKEGISKYYGTAWRSKVEPIFINKDTLSVYNRYADLLLKEKQIKPDSLHCTIYAVKALKAGLGKDFEKLDKYHKKIWKKREYAGWSVGYILTKYFGWTAYLILSNRSSEYKVCKRNYKKDGKYHVYKQPNIPIKRIFDFDNDKQQIENLLNQNEFGWGFSEQGWHTWITRFNILKECNWEGAPSIKYEVEGSKPLFISTKFTKFYDYNSHIIIFPPKNIQKVEDNDCVFDVTKQTDDFLHKIPEFSNYTWDATKKIATIKLENGNTLLATRGGCDHFAVYGELLLKNSNLQINDEEEIFKKALWIAKKLFNKSDYEIFKKAIKQNNYEKESNNAKIYITFNQEIEMWCNGTLVIENKKNGEISIEIGYYIC